MIISKRDEFSVFDEEEEEIKTETYKYLYVEMPAQKTFYLGYELKLTSLEFSILLHLIRHPEIYSYPEADLCNSSSISVEICRINAKAQKIGGRKLIISSRGRGYMLNPYM